MADVKCSGTLGWYSQQQSPCAFAIGEKQMTPRHGSHLFHDFMMLTTQLTRTSDLIFSPLSNQEESGQFALSSKAPIFAGRQPRVKFSNAGM